MDTNNRLGTLNLNHDWPQPLRALWYASDSVDSALAELDDSQLEEEEDRLVLMSLAASAYELRERIRAEGERRLAAWEKGQAAEAGLPQNMREKLESGEVIWRDDFFPD